MGTLLLSTSMAKLLDHGMEGIHLLPEELLIHTLSYLDATDLPTVRLVSARFRMAASEHHFREIRTTVFNDYRFSDLPSPLHCSPLAHMVRAVTINTRKVPVMPNDYPYTWTIAQVGNAIGSALGFPSLRSLSLNLTAFSIPAYWNDEVVLNHLKTLADGPFHMLEFLFKNMVCMPSLADRPLRELKLYGIPALDRQLLLNSPEFQKAICATRQLTLHFGRWTLDAPQNIHPRRDHPFSEKPFAFTASLTKWLTAGQEKREKLNLLFGDYVGYYPKIDLSSVHCPWLKELTLGGVTITHDEQLRWIVDHGRTLQTLRLHNCPIITQVLTYMETDKNLYPKPNECAADPVAFNNKKMFWKVVLDRFVNGLVKLRHFQVTFLGPSGKIEDAESGMVDGRYKVYMAGHIVTHDYSTKVDEKFLKVDTKAYIRLLKYTGQWK